jgi:glutamate dehydrogenase/leucine dehydrogenase
MLAWEGREVYEKLEKIMKDVYVHSKKCAEEYHVSLADGANIYAFLKVGSRPKYWEGHGRNNLHGFVGIRIVLYICIT